MMHIISKHRKKNLIKILDLFNSFDCLIGPVVSDEAFKLGEN